MFFFQLVNAAAAPIRGVYNWLTKWLPGARLISGLSLPAKWAGVALLFLLINWTAAIVSYFLHGDENSGMEWFWYILVPIPFLIIIPILTFYLVKYLLLEEQSPYPDIDQIWSDGLQRAAATGIYLSRTPLFIVLGVPGKSETRSIAEQTKLEWVVDLPETGKAPISFYASPEAVIVFLSGCSCVSRLSQVPKFGGGELSLPEQSSNKVASGTLSEPMMGGTIDAYHPAFQAESSSPQTLSSSDAFRNLDRGTLFLEEGQQFVEPTPTPKSRTLTSQDSLDCENRLRHVCGLIRKERQPLCPINGIVTVLPFELVESAGSQLPHALQRDFAVLRDQLQVRCPNTVVVSGMECEEGFLELIKRLPHQQASENRFGKGCDLWAVPEKERLDAVAQNAIAVFEDWIYTLFREESALRKENNSRLFMLLCRVRGTFATNLRAALAEGLGIDPNVAGHLTGEQFLFGGCYFGATGKGSGRQAFVRSVFTKVLQQDGELDWTPTAKSADQRLFFLANIAASVGMLALVSIAVMLIQRFATSAGP